MAEEATSMGASDEDLMTRVATEDDRGALEVLERRHRGPLIGWLGRCCGSSRADDVAQTTWLNVWERRETWRPDGRFQAWLYRIARNAGYRDFRDTERDPPGPYKWWINGFGTAIFFADERYEVLGTELLWMMRSLGPTGAAAVQAYHYASLDEHEAAELASLRSQPVRGTHMVPAHLGDAMVGCMCQGPPRSAAAAGESVGISAREVYYYASLYKRLIIKGDEGWGQVVKLVAERLSAFERPWREILLRRYFEHLDEVVPNQKERLKKLVGPGGTAFCLGYAVFRRLDDLGRALSRCMTDPAFWMPLTTFVQAGRSRLELVRHCALFEQSVLKAIRFYEREERQ